ncbi:MULTISPECIES: TAXI family TRAP transporter solute-binding subunit [Thermococcus]|uniref:TRAP-type transporter, periplasmic component n=2 Tax=Thermococcus sibiricus TaxID=172049 RepID=C6A1E7_THESM|nr:MULTISPECIES: TAXI family TRAP transporter solute-binding subunit [Thermococcus]KUK28927.1 MAG: TRAP-type transporter, periplasmic component [Thermococcus sp. 40_45]HII67184.1 TAXI family TRAP transporter solute-binding subunit [Thermococcaceae archaeon]ACS89442.1 TRAP-type transporter, periplasmic component [Thermococcus sibiricus MM 739]KUK18359.1 MAG: TRAP-type transporter, periplasmic component [Thermococcus sibiricus]MBC7094666.1 TAXI family TRAP transporter solute-binding subunit [The
MKWKAIGLILVLALGLVISGCTQQETQTTTQAQEITIYTGGTGGVYFPLGSKYAEILSKNGVPATAVTSGASVANAKAIGDGTAQAGILQNDVAYYAYKGLYMFEGQAITNIRGVAALYPETVQFIVRADSDIKTLSDLAGKKVAIGAPGSGTAVAAEQVLRAAGVWDSIEKVNQDFNEASQSLKLGQVDAAVIVSGIPTPSVNQIAVQTPVRVLSIPDDTLNKLKEEGYIFYVRQIVPKDTYNGVDVDTPTIAVKAMLAVGADLPEDTVYQMTKILFENVDQLRAVHQKAQAISLETALDGMSIPLHPGAIKYYEEKGLTIPENLKG